MTRLFWIPNFLFAITASAWSQVSSQPVEGLRDNTPRVHVLRGATLVSAPGKEIKDATIVLRDG